MKKSLQKFDSFVGIAYLCIIKQGERKQETCLIIETFFLNFKTNQIMKNLVTFKEVEKFGTITLEVYLSPSLAEGKKPDGEIENGEFYFSNDFFRRKSTNSMRLAFDRVTRIEGAIPLNLLRDALVRADDAMSSFKYDEERNELIRNLPQYKVGIIGENGLTHNSDQIFTRFFNSLKEATQYENALLRMTGQRFECGGAWTEIFVEVV